MQHMSTTPTINDSPRHSAIRRRRLQVVLAFAVVLSLLSVLCYLAWSRNQRSKFDARVRELNGVGIPTDVPTLYEFYALPDGAADSTDLYLSAFEDLNSELYVAKLKDVPVVDIAMPEFGESWPNLKQSTDFVLAFAPTLETLQRAHQLGGHARFNVQFEDGFGCLLEHVQSVRQLSQLHQVDIVVNAIQGDAAEALKGLQTGFTTAGCLKYEPILVSQHVSVRSTEHILHALERAMASVEFSDEQLVALQTTIRQIDFRSAYKNAYRGEIALVFIAFENPTTEGLDMLTDDSPLDRMLLMSAARFGTMVRHSQCLTETVELMDERWPEVLKESKEILEEGNRSSGGLTREMFYPFVKSLRLPIKIETKLEIADTLLAIRRYELAHNRLPESLKELSPEFLPQVPMDPMAPGSLLKWKQSKTANGKDCIKVYSVGLNGVDDGGSDELMTDREYEGYFMPKDLIMRLLPLKRESVEGEGGTSK